MGDREFTWPTFRGVWRREALFQQMAQMLRVNLSRACQLDQGEAIRAAHLRCFECRHAAECRNWLEASEGLPLPPTFCINREFFTRCNRSECQN